MVKKNKHLLLFSACAAALSLSIKGFSSHGDVKSECAKIAIADYEKLLQLLPEFSTTEQDFKNYVASQQEIQKKQIDSFKQRVEEFKKNEKNLSPEERKIKQENLSRDELELQRMAVDIQRKIEDRTAEGINRLKEILEKNYVDPYAKDNKIDFILNKECVTKVYNSKYDITEELGTKIKKGNNKIISSTAKK